MDLWKHYFILRVRVKLFVVFVFFLVVWRIIFMLCITIGVSEILKIVNMSHRQQQFKLSVARKTKIKCEE